MGTLSELRKNRREQCRHSRRLGREPECGVGRHWVVKPTEGHRREDPSPHIDGSECAEDVDYVPRHQVGILGGDKYFSNGEVGSYAWGSYRLLRPANIGRG